MGMNVLVDLVDLAYERHGEEFVSAAVGNE